ncbi:MAG: thioesterase family protein [Clostridiales bacterium]|nr:thioesterase family protein [Clostridiales bacterium]MCF8021588.1 thioesterase family protein [Clostridiales bacterium]
MNKAGIEVGLEGTVQDIVNEKNTAVAYGSGSVSVFATPAMIGLMEKAALSSVDNLLQDGFTTVGIKMKAEHLAATPVGMNVSATAKLTKVDGRRLLFSIDAWDGVELIGRGEHERFIVSSEKFAAKAEAKRSDN